MLVASDIHDPHSRRYDWIRKEAKITWMPKTNYFSDIFSWIPLALTDSLSICVDKKTPPALTDSLLICFETRIDLKLKTANNGTSIGGEYTVWPQKLQQKVFRRCLVLLGIKKKKKERKKERKEKKTKQNKRKEKKRKEKKRKGLKKSDHWKVFFCLFVCLFVCFFKMAA